jgi:transcriptional regulator with XRE-family HTH domain
MSTTTDLLKRLRARKLSQAEIQRRTGIPQPRLSKWEKGEAPVGADDALKLAALEAELIAAESADPAPATAQV